MELGVGETDLSSFVDMIKGILFIIVLLFKFNLIVIFEQLVESQRSISLLMIYSRGNGLLMLFIFKMIPFTRTLHERSDLPNQCIIVLRRSSLG